MDTVNKYRNIIEKVLKEVVAIPLQSTSVRDRTVFDRSTDNYLIVREGWEKAQHIDYCVVHVEILNDKIWIQEDGTEWGIALDLEREGIPKSDIVLGFQPPEVRPYTDYAVA